MLRDISATNLKVLPFAWHQPGALCLIKDDKKRLVRGRVESVLAPQTFVYAIDNGRFFWRNQKEVFSVPVGPQKNDPIVNIPGLVRIHNYRGNIRAGL